MDGWCDLRPIGMARLVQFDQKLRWHLRWFPLANANPRDAAAVCATVAARMGAEPGMLWFSISLEVWVKDVE